MGVDHTSWVRFGCPLPKTDLIEKLMDEGGEYTFESDRKLRIDMVGNHYRSGGLDNFLSYGGAIMCDDANYRRIENREGAHEKVAEALRQLGLGTDLDGQIGWYVGLDIS